MLRTIRLNAHPTKARAMEEVRGLILAFAGHPITRKPGFSIDASMFQGEFHTTVTADVDTNSDGFLSTMIARVLSSHLRVPVEAAAAPALPARGVRASLISAPVEPPRQLAPATLRIAARTGAGTRDYRPLRRRLTE